MPKIQYVDHARVRYARVPVLDEATGQQAQVVTGRVTRRTGRQVSRRVTTADHDKPLAPETCERCHEPIIPRGHPDYPGHEGDAYRWVAVRVSPYYSQRRVRHARCGSWQPWDLSSALWAQLARISHDFHDSIWSAESEDDIRSALDQAAQEVRDIADAKHEAAGNIEEGFGHETEQSAGLGQAADDLETWAGDIESADIPELEAEEDPNDLDDGINPEDHRDEQLQTWRDACENELTIIDESPV